VKEYKKELIAGIIFGAVAPFLGLFFGLQLSIFLGNILTFPLIIESTLIDKPFGEFSIFWWGVSFLLSMILWPLIFIIIKKALIKTGVIANSA